MRTSETDFIHNNLLRVSANQMAILREKDKGKKIKRRFCHFNNIIIIKHFILYIVSLKAALYIKTISVAFILLVLLFYLLYLNVLHSQSILSPSLWLPPKIFGEDHKLWNIFQSPVTDKCLSKQAGSTWLPSRNMKLSFILMRCIKCLSWPNWTAAANTLRSWHFLLSQNTFK